jgi:hypothetical protein
MLDQRQEKTSVLPKRTPKPILPTELLIESNAILARFSVDELGNDPCAHHVTPYQLVSYISLVGVLGLMCQSLG